MKPQAPENQTVSNVKVGKPDTILTVSAHVKGTREGNSTQGIKKERGVHDEGLTAKGTARRSTGINPKNRNPIDPKMPNLSPA